MTTETTALLEAIERLESKVDALAARQQLKEHYTTEDVAAIMGRAEFTVREWCRLGRIRAAKQASGRGKHAGWSIPHAELVRIQREGLLPDLRTRIG